MRALNKRTGQLEKVYVKALDSMPVGTIVEFDGQASDIPSGWEEVDNVIWNNPNPTNEFAPQTITFNDTYSYYDVIGWVDGVTFKTTRVYLNKRTIMQIMEGGYIRTRYATATSNSIEFSKGIFYQSYASGTDNNYQVIPYQIIGYK